MTTRPKSSILLTIPVAFNFYYLLCGVVFAYYPQEFLCYTGFDKDDFGKIFSFCSHGLHCPLEIRLFLPRLRQTNPSFIDGPVFIFRENTVILVNGRKPYYNKSY